MRLSAVSSKGNVTSKKDIELMEASPEAVPPAGEDAGACNGGSTPQAGKDQEEKKSYGRAGTDVVSACT
ncbi:hypothetical protein BRADI_4g11725v3 [Brachypodium distachyon]|uniref:Uncharacterized protein n=1 Tax=Brachypodium distachyon TaxID=15368 RepID=A0A2K2CM65_BRADI|nr:hypothetical protein BRADI_4g11725v3 [Brachypodium distachyon]